jgi:hypothetical protein
MLRNMHFYDKSFFEKTDKYGYKFNLQLRTFHYSALGTCAVLFISINQLRNSVKSNYFQIF